jgi:YD repeat-containing protein
MTSHTHPDNGDGHRRVDTYGYYPSGTQRGYLQAEIVDAGGLNLTTQYEYNSVGVVIRKIDPRGHDHQYVVNQLDQVVRELSPEVVDGSGIRYKKDYFYDANNNLVRMETENRTDLESGGAIVAANPTWTTTFEYEILNHLVRKSEEVEPSHFAVTEYAYDGNRNRTLTRYGEATAGRQTNNVVQMLYDERDLPFREIRAPGSLEQSSTQYNYDGNRNRVRTSQGLEDTPRPTLFTYDGFNRLVSTADAMGNVTTNNYDANGNRINTAVFGELIDVPGGSANVRLSQTAFLFDPMNRLTNQSVAFFNATNQAPIGDGFATTQTIYSDNSQVLAVINDNNHGTTNRYDTANRLSVVTDAKGNTITYTYDSDSNVSEMMEAEKSDLDGHVEAFTTTFGYDNLNRLASTTDNIGNLNRSGYDSRDNRTVTIDALTNKVLYAYDGLNRLTQTTRLMTQDGTGTTPTTGQIVTRQTWDDTSRLTSQIDDNTNATTYLYDGLNRKFATVYADFTGQCRNTRRATTRCICRG